MNVPGLAVAAVFVLLPAQAPPAAGNAQRGRAVFHDAGLGANGAACAACHTDEPEDAPRGADGLLRSGHSLWQVGTRKYWRGDKKRASFPTLLDALNACVDVWQGAKPLSGGVAADLVAYLQTLAPPRRPPSAPIVIQTALEADGNYDRDAYRGGDGASGRALFYRACHACHPGGRFGLGPAVAGANLGLVARKVREGNGLLRGDRKPGDWMPFYGTDRLTDRHVADVAAYIATLKK